MDIAVEYRLIQISLDEGREERKNVAVLAWYGNRSMVRAIGVDQRGRVNLLPFERLLPEWQRETAAHYAVWVQCWQEMVARCGGDAALLDKELQREAAHCGGQFTASEGGEIYIEGSEDRSDEAILRQATKELFVEMFSGVEFRGYPLDFLDAVDRALRGAGLTRSPQYTRDETIEVARVGRSSSLLFFPFYLARDGAPVGIKMLPIAGADWETTSVAANDAILSFDLAVTAGHLRREHCIILSGTPEGHALKMVARLNEAATVIDVFDRDAGRQLKAASKAGMRNE
jgi:hypothetical protein